MTDPELRELVRGAIARHLQSDTNRSAGDLAFDHQHASHQLLPLAPGSDGDDACIIEPAVRCNHCGYCVSFGH
jgi:hypothetical protein